MIQILFQKFKVRLVNFWQDRTYHFIMAKANSFKNQPWSDLERGAYTIHEDDFVHTKLSTVKVTKKSETSTVSLKKITNQKDGKVTSAEEVKFWFPFRTTKTLYARLRNDSYKLMYDHGMITHNQILYNFYASVQGKKNLESSQFKVGLETITKEFTSNWRLRFHLDQSSLSIQNKTSLINGNWTYATLNAFNLTGRLWNRSAIQLGFTDNASNKYYLRLNGGKNKQAVVVKNFLDEITGNFIHTYNQNNRFGLQSVVSVIDKEVVNASAVWQHKSGLIQNTAFKVRGDINRNVSFSVKNNISGYGNYIFGVNIADFGRANRFSYGLQLDLNI